MRPRALSIASTALPVMQASQVRSPLAGPDGSFGPVVARNSEVGYWEKINETVATFNFIIKKLPLLGKKQQLVIRKVLIFTTPHSVLLNTITGVKYI